MKIGIFDPYLDTLGGGEKYMLTAASCLSEKHEVFLFWDKNILPAASSRFGIKTEKIKLTKNIFSQRVSLWERIMESMKYDRIFYLSDGSIPIVFPKKLLLHFQFPVEWVKGKSLPNKLKMQHVSTVICNSQFTKQYIDKAFGIQSEVVYPPSTSEARVAKTEKKENIILTVGRYSKLAENVTFKKQEFMIHAFKEFSKKEKNWKFVVVVSFRPEDKEGVEKLKRMIGNFPITIEENLENKKLENLYKRAKIYWHAAGYGINLDKNPELAEHFGIATVQAMEQGTVPVVIDAGGQKEIVENGVNGLLWSTKEELLSQTTYLIKNSQIWEKLSKKAKERSGFFSIESFCSRIQEIFQ